MKFYTTYHQIYSFFHGIKKYKNKMKSWSSEVKVTMDDEVQRLREFIRKLKLED